jgi:multiple sugar transport system substrate-binding protein
MTGDGSSFLGNLVRDRRLDRRRFVKGTAALATATTLAAVPRVIVPARAQSGTKVSFWTAFVDPDLSILKKMVETFNGQSQSFQVELTQIPPAQVTDVTKLMTAVRGGTGPDVYHLDRFIVAQRAADGLLQDLSAYMGGEDLLENYLPFARDEATFQGKPYALPFDTDARALYYNKGMLTDAGVDVAEFDPAKGPLTWDRVKEIAAKINKKGPDGNYTQMGFVPWIPEGWHYTYGFSWGASFFDQSKCEVTPDDPKMVAASQWVQDYCKDFGTQQVSAFGSPVLQAGFPPPQHPFALGRQAMFLTGDWWINNLRLYAPKMDYGITFIPAPKQGDAPSTWAGGWSVVMPQGAKQPKEAFEFMKWIAGEPGQRLYVADSAHLPTWKSLLPDASLFDPRHKFFSDKLLPIAKNRPPLPVGAKYWDELTTAWQAIYLDQQPPEAALKTVKDRVQPQLQRFCPITIGS